MNVVLLIFNVLLFITIPSVSYLFMTQYPKEINDLFGYRTKRSMSSTEAWLLANSYCSRLMFKLSCITIFIQVVLFIFVDPQVSLLSTIALWITLLLSVIIVTERMLKKKLG